MSLKIHPCFVSGLLFLGVCFPLTLAAEPLWPEGKMPHAQAGNPAPTPKYDVYAPEAGKKNGCAMVVCPGGGYGGLAVDHEGRQIGQWCANLGITAYVLQYRLGSQGYHFPTQLADVQRAVRLVRHRAAESGIDPARIGVIGFSAGGHLASMAATKFDEKAYEPVDDTDAESARPDFAVLCYAVISMSTEFTHAGSRKNLLGKDVEPDSPEARHVSSELNVTGRTPPTFLFHTTADTVVPAENSLLFYEALRRHKVPCEMHIYQDGPHGVGLMLGTPVLGTWPVHLRDWMRGRGYFAPGAKRVALQGTLMLDGQAVPWGAVTFHPEDENLPVTTLRVMGGKFKSDETNGPAPGKCRLVVAASIWERTKDPRDGTVILDKAAVGDVHPLTVEVVAGQPLDLVVTSR